jgi:hypothetical protein
MCSHMLYRRGRVSSSSQASADAATLSAQSREIAARLIRWFLDDFTRTSIAPVVNQAMSVTSGDIRRLAYSIPLRHALPNASHDLQAVLAMIPAEVAPNRRRDGNRRARDRHAGAADRRDLDRPGQCAGHDQLLGDAGRSWSPGRRRSATARRLCGMMLAVLTVA